MKKIIILASLALTTLLVSCNDYLDVNHDPSNPESVPNSLLIPSAEAYLTSTVGGDIFNTAGFFCQYTEQAPEANQYNALCEYSFDNSLFNLSYSNLYAGALEDLNRIQKQAEANENWADYYVAAVLRAYAYQVLVDYLDQIPYTEALQGATNFSPKWDNGKDVYAGILTELDEAEAKLPDNMYPISADILLGKDLNKWKQFASALRLRIYMRSSNVEDNSAKIKALIDQNNFPTADVKFDNYDSQLNKYNPWYETYNQLTQNHVASYPIITYMKSTQDPRMQAIFKPATLNNDYNGMIPGSKTKISATIKNSSFSFVNYAAFQTMPVYLITQSEVQFFLAEAYLRFYGDDAKAKTAYETAITNNFATRGLSGAGDIYGAGKPAAWASATSNDAKLELIGKQKWVALCMLNNTEAWSEARRMGYPKMSSATAAQINASPAVYTAGDLISPWVNALSQQDKPVLVKKLFAPQNALQTNPNTPKQNSYAPTVPVWWEKN